MTIHSGWDAFPARPPRSTRVTWGVFDGVHTGHQSILDALAAWARKDGAEALVVTFDPHPQTFLRGAEIPLVHPIPERARLLARHVGGTALVLPFDRALAELSAEAFFHEILAGRLGAGGILAGYDSRFGRRGEGTPGMLRRLADPLGIPVRTAEPRLLDGRPVKSSRLRKAIADGDLAGACALMGRPVCLVGPVVEGDRRGRTLGYPTANLDCRGLVLPPAGVYVVRGSEREPDGGPWGGVLNIGRRPTFGGQALSVEVHFLDLPAGRDLYGRTIHVDLLARLRGEETFPDADALRARIAADCEAAQGILARQPAGG